MNKLCKIITFLAFLHFSIAPIWAEEKCDSVYICEEVIIDSLSQRLDTAVITKTDSIANPDFLQKVISKLPSWLQNYASSLLAGNVDKTFEKKVDMSWGIIPSYRHEDGFGLLGAGTGQYRVNRKDSTLAPSDFTISLNASLNGFFVLDIYGNHLFPDHKSRLSYEIELYRKRLEFWGITSAETAINPQSIYDRRQIDIKAKYIYNFTNKFYSGVAIQANYTDANNEHEYLLGNKLGYYVTGLGLSFEYDTRDHLITPSKGIHVVYKPMIFPQFLGNAGATFHSHNFIFNGYMKMWKGSVLAFDWYTKINSERTPWTMREMISADGIRMRGYYMGRIVDNNQVTAQIEYRQQVWNRFGIVLWGGYGTLFPDFDALKDYKNLQWYPNYGVGLRFEFKKNVNLRADYGFGKDTSGLIVTIGEAF